jgi:tetratricopeptide (TPR) repeat protein
VVNQHAQTLIVPFETLRDEFSKGVRSVGVTLFLLDFAAPLSLGRAWCVFEAATALASGACFEVIMPPRDQAAFADALVTDFASLASKTCTVDVERARAREEKDETNIRAAIVAMGGFARVNQLVISAMREWMAGAGRAALAALHPLARETAGLAPALATLLLEQGRLDAAEQLFRVAVGGLRAAALRANIGLAEVLWTRGRHAEAEPLLRELLPELRAGGAPLARDALRTSNLLALVLFERGSAGEAGVLYRETLAGRRALLGASHPDTLISLNNMAFFLRTQGCLGDAEALYREALQGRREVLGAFHKDTLGSLNGLAVTMRAAGRLGEAEPLFREALSVRARTLGNAHASTVRSEANLGILLYEMGAREEARPLYQRALAGFAAALGEAHADTLGAMLNLAVLEWTGGEGGGREAALGRARAAAEGFARVLGEAHSDTQLARGNVAAMEAAAAGAHMPPLQQRAPR